MELSIHEVRNQLDKSQDPLLTRVGQQQIGGKFDANDRP